MEDIKNIVYRLNSQKPGIKELQLSVQSGVTNKYLFNEIRPVVPQK